MSAIYPHRIRLRGPWEYEPLARADGGPLPPAGRMTMPCRWREAGLGEFAGTVRFRRRFHWPSGIDAAERIWLTCDGLAGQAAFTLNGQPLGRGPCDSELDFEATPFLQARNELLVVVSGAADGGLWGETALEVRRTAFLRGLTVTVADKLITVEVAVVGQSDRPLELYTLLDQATAHYATVQPTSAGRLVRQVLPAAGQPGQVRVELVDGGVVWYPLSAEVRHASARHR